MPISRREFVQSAGALAAASLVSAPASAGRTQPAGGGARPVLVGSANSRRAADLAFEKIRGGAHPLDAIVAGINLIEEDESDHSVGYGGLPNEEGVVELDSCVMDGRTHKAGAVAALRNIKTPSSVALRVMRRTDHVLIVGEGALRFARAHGFEECNLLTDKAREIWLKWKETHSENDDWVPEESAQGSARGAHEESPEFTYGTVTCMGLTADGDLAGCTSTSGLSYKIPGRVGDSPILGAGLFVDNAAGACGSTGRGEANLQNLSSFLVVERMRAGLTPEEACREVLQRVAENTEPRLRSANGEPDFQLCLYALRRDGLTGGASMRSGARMAVHDGTTSSVVAIPSLYT